VLATTAADWPADRYSLSIVTTADCGHLPSACYRAVDRAINLPIDRPITRAVTHSWRLRRHQITIWPRPATHYLPTRDLLLTSSGDIRYRVYRATVAQTVNDRTIISTHSQEERSSACIWWWAGGWAVWLMPPGREVRVVAVRREVRILAGGRR